MEPIAQRKVIIVDRNSHQEECITFEIMPPRTIDDEENYLCEARITGDLQESFEVGGVDSLQALMLAIQCLDTRFVEMKNDQYDFFWPDRSNPVKSFDLISEDLKRFCEM